MRPQGFVFSKNKNKKKSSSSSLISALRPHRRQITAREKLDGAELAGSHRGAAGAICFCFFVPGRKLNPKREVSLLLLIMFEVRTRSSNKTIQIPTPRAASSTVAIVTLFISRSLSITQTASKAVRRVAASVGYYLLLRTIFLLLLLLLLLLGQLDA